MTSSPEPGASLRVAVLGAGPVGLETALAALEADLEVRVYEAADHPSANVRAWGHVRMFSPWEMNVSARMRRALLALGAGLDADPGETPTGHELADRALDPLWTRPPVAACLELGARVVQVGRRGLLKHEEIATAARAARPFRILLRGADGTERVANADVVLDCTGASASPHPVGDGGIPAPGEVAARDRISSTIPDPARDPDRWRGRSVLLVGAGHSAQTAAVRLASAADALGSSVVWAIREETPDLGLIPDDPLPARGRLTAEAEALLRGGSPALTARLGVVVDSIARTGSGVRVHLRDRRDAIEAIEVDEILGLTGGVGDHTLYRQLQVHECYATSGPMKLAAALLGGAGGDCLDQESHGVDTLTSPEPGFFILGAKSYGRTNTFLLQVGYRQVDEVMGTLAPA